MIICHVYATIVCQNTHHLFVTCEFMTYDRIQWRPIMIRPRFYTIWCQINVFFFLFPRFHACFPGVVSICRSNLFYGHDLKFPVYLDVNGCVIRNTIPINILRIGHHNTMLSIHFQIIIHILNDIARIVQQLPSRCRGGCRHIHFVKGARLRTRLAIQTVGRHLDGELSFVQDILHERITLFLHLLLRRTPRRQQFL